MLIKMRPSRLLTIPIAYNIQSSTQKLVPDCFVFKKPICPVLIGDADYSFSVCISFDVPCFLERKSWMDRCLNKIPFSRKIICHCQRHRFQNSSGYFDYLYTFRDVVPCIEFIVGVFNYSGHFSCLLVWEQFKLWSSLGILFCQPLFGKWLDQILWSSSIQLDCLIPRC